jgi:hypothetical protein
MRVTAGYWSTCSRALTACSELHATICVLPCVWHDTRVCARVFVVRTQVQDKLVKAREYSRATQVKSYADQLYEVGTNQIL